MTHVIKPPGSSRKCQESEPTVQESPSQQDVDVPDTRHPCSAEEDEARLLLPENTDQLHQWIRKLETQIQTLQGELSTARESPYRRRLPVTRRSVTHKFAVGQHEGYITVGLYDDNRPGELFLTMAKQGSTVGGLMDTIGILTSLALQYGVPIETLTGKLEHVSFEPSGWTRDPTIRRASSIIDYIFRWLGMQFSQSDRQEKLTVYGHESDH